MVQRSLAQTMTNLDENLLKNLVDNNYVTQEQVVSLCSSQIKKIHDLEAVHVALFALTKLVSEQFATIKNVNADSINTMLLHIAPRARLRGAPQDHGVLKAIVKTKHSKATPEIKRITPKVVQAFVNNVLLNRKQALLLQSGVARDVVDSLVGVPIDPVQGIGAADPNIWGPVV